MAIDRRSFLKGSGGGGGGDGAAEFAVCQDGRIVPHGDDRDGLVGDEHHAGGDRVGAVFDGRDLRCR